MSSPSILEFLSSFGAVDIYLFVGLFINFIVDDFSGTQERR